jgi:hypothetical protein
MNDFEKALENEARRLFGGLTYSELTPPLGADGRPPRLLVRPRIVRGREGSRFEARRREELLGEGHATNTTLDTRGHRDSIRLVQ